MARIKPKTVPFRRIRERKTNYTKRMKLLLSSKPRIVIRFSNTRIIAQLVKFEQKGDKILLGLTSDILIKKGWKASLKNLPAAYLTGLYFGVEAQNKGIKEGILDTGLRTPLHRGKAFAFMKGCLDSGFAFPSSDSDIFPEETRLSGKHIQDYLAANEAVFTKYLKDGLSSDTLKSSFENIKKEIKK